MPEDEHLREAMVREGMLPRYAFGTLVAKGGEAKPDAAAATMSDADWNKLSPSARLTASLKAKQR